MNSLYCPITKKLFQDPVIAADGQTYERRAIVAWFRKYGTSPLTREPMENRTLQTNHIVTKIISEWRALPMPQPLQHFYKLDEDIKIKTTKPLFISSSKAIYEVEWINRQGPPIVLIQINEAAGIREASFYLHLSCDPHIVRTFGLVESGPDSVMLLQEHAPAGDLFELLREHGFRPPEMVLIQIFIQISDAMICLADNGIVHGDLACRNVLVFQSHAIEVENNLVKLTDFGLTRDNGLSSAAGNNTASSTMPTIPIRYAAPEILQTMNEENYSEKSDVYSMGVLMWEACSRGTLPYASVENDNEVRNRKLQNEKLPQPLCSSRLWHIIKECWRQLPENRPNFRYLKQSLSMLRLGAVAR